MSGPGRDAPNDVDLNGQRIALVSVYYWPEDVGIAPYSTAIAEHLAQLGAAVTVVAGIPHYPAWSVGASDRFRLRRREVKNAVDIRRVRVFVPRKQDAIRRALYEFTFLANGGALRVGQQLDAVIGVVPSLTGGLIARRLSRQSNSPLGLIVQDLTGPAAAQSGVQGGGRVADFVRRLEANIMRGADQVAIASDGFRSYLVDAGVADDRIAEIRNWSRTGFAEVGMDGDRVRMGWPQDKTVVLHAGNMGMKQALENVIDAARLAVQSAPGLHFVLMGDGSQRGMLEARAAGLSNVTFTPPCDRSELSNALAAADVLLVNERSSVINMSLPSKLTSYFAAGRPVVASVPPDGTTAREVGRSGGGIVTAADRPSDLVATTAKLALDPDLRKSLGAAGRRYAEEALTERAGLHAVSTWVAELAGSRSQGGRHVPS